MNLPGLMVTLLLVATLALATDATLGSLLPAARMTSAVNELVRAAYRARSESIKRMRDVAICRSSDGLQCDHRGGWEQGFLVFVNLDRDDPPRVDPGETLLQAGPAYRGTITANRGAFVFRPGNARAVNGTFTVCDQRGPLQARAVIVSYTGRPRTAAATAAAARASCPS